MLTPRCLGCFEGVYICDHPMKMLVVPELWMVPSRTCPRLRLRRGACGVPEVLLITILARGWAEDLGAHAGANCWHRVGSPAWPWGQTRGRQQRKWPCSCMWGFWEPADPGACLLVAGVARGLRCGEGC